MAAHIILATSYHVDTSFYSKPPYKMTGGFCTRVRPFYRGYSMGDSKIVFSETLFHFHDCWKEGIHGKTYTPTWAHSTASSSVPSRKIPVLRHGGFVHWTHFFNTSIMWHVCSFCAARMATPNKTSGKDRKGRKEYSFPCFPDLTSSHWKHRIPTSLDQMTLKKWGKPPKLAKCTGSTGSAQASIYRHV